MESIPEISDAQLTFNISRRYHGMFEVGISYAGTYIKRYPLIVITDMFLLAIITNFPILGLWLFSRTKRNETIRRAYTKAIDNFVTMIKLDIANSMFDQGMME